MTTEPTTDQARQLAETFADYVPSIEGRDIVGLRGRYGLMIAGKERDARDGAVFATIDPSNGAQIAEVASAGLADVDDAVAAARAAFEGGWRDLNPTTRAKYVFRIARLLQDRAREFAVLESIDGGKPIREARDVDVPLAAAHFFYHAGWADKLDLAMPGLAARPVGVVGQIIPWNFPLLMAAWKIAPAIACGNTVVLKPAETTPLTALLLAELIAEADLPPGVVNVVTGAGPTGAALASHPGIDKVAFTGSTGVGKAIRRALAGTDTRLTLELGGKGAHVVFEDAAIDQAIEGIVDGIFFNQGHVCCAGSRLLVQESVADEVLSRLRRRVELLRVGNPLDKNTDVGAINSHAQLVRIREFVDSAVNEGCDVFQPHGPLPETGFWFPPTIVSGVGGSERIAREEVFGPVLTVQTFRTEAEAVAKANSTAFGLSAGVWTEKGSRILWMARRLRAGVVWANSFNQFDPSSPFGGMRQSGFGREGGRHGLAEYLDFSPSTGSPATAAAPAVDLGTPPPPGTAHLDVRKTYKLFIGGAFPRSESGRTMAVHDAAGGLLAHVALASRKDARDAVRAARGAQESWEARTAYNRGQILYRLAEVIEGRREQFAGELAAVGLDPGRANADVASAIDACMFWAGFADKLDQLVGGVNPVAGPFLNLSTPEPQGVCALACADGGGLAGIIGLVAPALMAGNAVVALAGGQATLVMSTLGEVVATSDVPAGVVNLLTGDHATLLPWLAGHDDVDLLDLSGAPAALIADLEGRSAESVKRVTRTDGAQNVLTASAFTEIKTVWHPARI